jgi:hypothetical protein
VARSGFTSKNTVSEHVPTTMYKVAREGEYDLSTYYWIDPLYNQSVRKKSIFTKFNFEKENKSGIIGMGYNYENLSLVNEFKNFTYIGKPELIIGSVMTLVIALVISKLHTVKKKVEFVPRDHILPPDILNRYKDMEFWRKL